jgi:hypothetical protein
VLNRYMMATALAAVCSMTALAAQQSGQAQPKTTDTKPAAETAKATGQKTAATVVGCVYREKDVPGRAPNVAERLGVSEDFILAEVGKTPPEARKSADGTPGATGTSGQSAAMYKLEFVSRDKLATFVGRRVEAVGRIDASKKDQVTLPEGVTTSTVDKIVGHDRVNLAEFEVQSIKEVAGTCPASPTGH